MTEKSASPETPLRILIVEDEALIAMMLEDILEDLGHRVVGVAASVRQALDLLERSGEIDGAILDANLGGDSAIPIAREFRRREIPFVLASGYAGEELRFFGFSAASLRKPYRSDEVGQALEDEIWAARTGRRG